MVSSEEAVREIIDRLVDAWNNHDVKGFASIFTEDADYISGAGQWLKGRPAIEQLLADNAETTGGHHTVTITDTWIKFLRPDVALVHSTWEMVGKSVGTRDESSLRRGILTQVLIHDSGKWRIAAVQNTDIEA